MYACNFINKKNSTGEGKTLSGKNSCREKFCWEKFCPNPYFAWGKILSRPAGSGKIYRPARSAGNFSKYFAYNWSLCVDKVQQSIKRPRKILFKSLKRPEKYCLEIWDRIFLTGVFPSRSFILQYWR